MSMLYWILYRLSKLIAIYIPWHRLQPASLCSMYTKCLQVVSPTGHRPTGHRPRKQKELEAHVARGWRVTIWHVEGVPACYSVGASRQSRVGFLESLEFVGAQSHSFRTPACWIRAVQWRQGHMVPYCHLFIAEAGHPTSRHASFSRFRTHFFFLFTFPNSNFLSDQFILFLVFEQLLASGSQRYRHFNRDGFILFTIIYLNFKKI